MPGIGNGEKAVKVPLIYYDKHGQRHVVGDAAVQIKNGEVIAVGKITEEVDGDVITQEILDGINLESFSLSAGAGQLYLIPPPNPASEAARRLGPLGMRDRSHVTDSNPNGEVRQCDLRNLHEPHEWQAEFGAYFDVYCPGNQGDKR